MIAFLVHVNGQRICLGGIGENGVMGTALDWVGGVDLEGKPFTRRLKLTVGGLNTVTKQHIHWATPELKAGDTVTIRIVEADSVDPSSAEKIAPTALKNSFPQATLN